MRELSFVIPIRVDTPDRLENCETVLRFLTYHFPESEIQLVEQDRRTQTAPLRASFPRVIWRFDFNDQHFRRGVALNSGILGSTRPCVCAYDTDVLIDPRALRESVHLISSGQWPIVIPFNCIFIEVSGDRRRKLIDTLDIRGLSTIGRVSAVPKHPDIGARVLSGAVMMCDTEVAILEGGYNRKMVSYGWEDIEFFKRFAKLGHYSYVLGNYSLIHLDHRRGPDSRINEMYQVNKMEFDKVAKMSRADLEKYVDKELRIAGTGVADTGRWIRRRRLRGNRVGFARAAHVMNKVVTKWRVWGIRGLARKIF
jgi:hypothetical protein